MPNAVDPIIVTLAADPHLARLVRMTATNVAALSSMSFDRIEDIRMAAEEAFIYACAAVPQQQITISFTVDESHVGMAFDLGVNEDEAQPDDEVAAYTDLILNAVCDSYELTTAPVTLHLDLKADV